MTSRDAIAAWRTEHIYFGRLLDLFQGELEGRLRAGKRPNHELMLEVLEYLHAYADRYHHARENAAFALLVARRAQFAPVVERLTQDYVLVARLGQRLLQYLNDAVEGDPPGGGEVADVAGTYLLFYREHIAAEEREVLQPASDTLTAEEWQAVANAAPRGFDPLFGVAPKERYGFFLGLAEAGFFPGIVLYLTYWFPQRERAQAVALFLTGIPVTSILGAPLSGLILDYVHWLGFSSWRWLLILEGSPAIVCGVLTYFSAARPA